MASYRQQDGSKLLLHSLFGRRRSEAGGPRPKVGVGPVLINRDCSAIADCCKRRERRVGNAGTAIGRYRRLLSWRRFESLSGLPTQASLGERPLFCAGG